MNVITKTPNDVPNLKELSKEKAEIIPGYAEKIGTVFTESSSTSDRPNYKICAEKSLSKKVIVNLSGENNIKLVTNRMKEHMEAYPETCDGFFVRFGDDKKGYKVEIGSKDDKDCIKINGINYKISQFIFNESIDKKIEHETIMMKIKEKISNMIHKILSLDIKNKTKDCNIKNDTEDCDIRNKNIKNKTEKGKIKN